MASMVTRAPLRSSKLQEFGDRLDFVGLAVHGNLAQAELGFGGPGADQVQRRHAARSRAAQRLAIDGHVAQTDQVRDVAQPRKATAVEHGRVQSGEDPFERVVRRDAVGQLQKGLEPRDAIGGEVDDVRPAIAVGDDATQRDGDDVDEAMVGASANARILQGTKVLLDRAHARIGGHAILRRTGEIRTNRMSVHLSQSSCRDNHGRFCCVRPGDWVRRNLHPPSSDSPGGLNHAARDDAVGDPRLPALGDATRRRAGLRQRPRRDREPKAEEPSKEDVEKREAPRGGGGSGPEVRGHPQQMASAPEEPRAGDSGRGRGHHREAGRVLLAGLLHPGGGPRATKRTTTRRRP